MRFLVSALLALGAAAAPTPHEPPDHPIGFRVLERLDSGRATPEHPQGRPLQIAVWYPAATAGAPLSFRDLVALTATETSFRKPSDAGTASESAVRAYRDFLGKAGASPDEVDGWLATRMKASRDAPPARGRAPLVLIAQGNGDSAADQAFLAEALALHGYVVATMPSQARIGGPMKSEDEIPGQADAQATDLAFAVSALQADAHVQRGRYGLVAHSFGARSALLLAMRDSGAAALVSLDGGIGAKTGKGLIDKARGFDLSRANAPVLHLYEEADAFMTPDFDLLRSLERCDRWLVRVDSMRHVHFSSTGILVRAVPSIAARTSADGATAAAWDVVAESTASFLDQFLAKSAAPLRWSPPESPLLHPLFLPRS